VTIELDVQFVAPLGSVAGLTQDFKQVFRDLCGSIGGHGSVSMHERRLRKFGFANGFGSDFPITSTRMSWLSISERLHMAQYIDYLEASGVSLSLLLDSVSRASKYTGVADGV